MKVKDLRFKLARIEAGLTQQDLADLTGASEATITRIETGRSIPDSKLKAELADILGRPGYELFSDAKGGDDE